MKREGDKVFLDKADAIRMNQLVRGRIDFDGFAKWFEVLGADEQAALIGDLCYFAYEAGVNESIYDEACGRAGFDGNGEFVSLMKRVDDGKSLNVGGFVRWLRTVDPKTRFDAFRLFVYLFGIAEGRRFQNEDRARCNHWWHRNLEDKRVVQSILDDPDYYKTTPRDDETILGGSHDQNQI